MIREMNKNVSSISDLHRPIKFANGSEKHYDLNLEVTLLNEAISRDLGNNSEYFFQIFLFPFQSTSAIISGFLL